MSSNLSKAAIILICVLVTFFGTVVIGVLLLYFLFKKPTNSKDDSAYSSISEPIESPSSKPLHMESIYANTAARSLDFEEENPEIIKMESKTQLSYEQLEALYQQEKLARLQLENDCDLLALENLRLSEELKKLQRLNSMSQPSHEKHLSASDAALVDQVLVEEDGDGLFANVVESIVCKACDGKNVLSVAFSNDDLVCGGTDNSVSIYSWNGNIYFCKSKVSLSAPVLALSICNDSNNGMQLIAAAAMDGSMTLIDSSNNATILQSFHDHQKYVVNVKFSNDGKYIASISYDKYLHIYMRNNAECENRYQLSKSFQFHSNPEGITFYQNVDVLELIVCVRENYQLGYISFNEQFDIRWVSMNEADWDTHVSFNALAVSISPSQQYLAVANDKHSIILMKPGTSIRLKVLVGHNCSEYGKPKLIWDTSSKYIYINSEGEPCIYVYSIFSGKVIEVLPGARRVGDGKGHEGLVKDICVHESNRKLLSGSFDHNLIVWSHTAL